MGSCLCFPILALTIWAILTAAAPDEDTREEILVYGDDVIVPTAYAVNAMEQLESFGLKINRDKSCIGGSFRESCGTDAFKGVNVTPVRLRTVWSSSRSPESYASWIAYANSFYDRNYRAVYDYIVEQLVRLYGPIPAKSDDISDYSLAYVDNTMGKLKSRWNKNLQKRQYYIWHVKSPKVINGTIGGWSMLLRFFAESANNRNVSNTFNPDTDHQYLPTLGEPDFDPVQPFLVRSYTHRSSSILVRQWR